MRTTHVFSKKYWFLSSLFWHNNAKRGLEERVSRGRSESLRKWAAQMDGLGFPKLSSLVSNGGWIHLPITQIRGGFVDSS